MSLPVFGRYMRVFCSTVIVYLAGALAAHAADAITYSGSIGSLPIILELTSPGPDGLRAGRYAYLAKGGDIPLHGMKSAGGVLCGSPRKSPAPKRSVNPLMVTSSTSRQSPRNGI